MIADIMLAQWRSMRLFRMARRRGGLAVSALAGAIWYGFWIVLAIGVQRFLAEESADTIASALPPGLLLLTIYWQMAPVVSATLGAGLNLRKLLIFPVRPEKLFAVELLLRLAGGAEMLLVLTGALVGLLRNPALGRPARAPWMIAAILLLVATNTGLAAGLRNLFERLLSRKHVREAVVLLMVISIAAPRVLFTQILSPEDVAWLSSLLRLPFWPWTAAAGMLIRPQPLTAMMWMIAWAAGAFFFGMWQFGRSLRFDADAALARTVAQDGPRGGVLAQAIYQAPVCLLPDPVGAVVEKELRSLARTPRFRMVFMMGFSFGLLVWLPLVLGKSRQAGQGIAENFLAIVSIYALTLLGQVSYWNAFGFDRSAARAYFLFPQSLSAILLGKNLAAGIMISLEIVMVTLVCWLVRIPIAATKIVETFSVTLVGALYIIAVGNQSSVRFPKPMASERVSQGGAASRYQALVFLVYPVALSPVALAYLARYAMDSQWAFSIALGAAAGVGLMMYIGSLRAAVRHAERDREVFVAELSNGEGPIATE